MSGKTESPKTSGSAGAGRDPQEQRNPRTGQTLRNDKELGNQQQQRKPPAADPNVEKSVDAEQKSL